MKVDGFSAVCRGLPVVTHRYDSGGIVLPDAESMVTRGSIEVAIDFPVAAHWCGSGEAVLPGVGR